MDHVTRKLVQRSCPLLQPAVTTQQEQLISEGTTVQPRTRADGTSAAVVAARLLQDAGGAVMPISSTLACNRNSIRLLLVVLLRELLRGISADAAVGGVRSPGASAPCAACILACYDVVEWLGGFASPWSLAPQLPLGCRLRCRSEVRVSAAPRGLMLLLQVSAWQQQQYTGTIGSHAAPTAAAQQVRASTTAQRCDELCSPQHAHC